MTDTEKRSYALAMNLFGNLAELPLDIDMPTIIRAISDLSNGKQPELSNEDYHAEMQKFQREVQAAGQQAVAKAEDPGPGSMGAADFRDGVFGEAVFVGRGADNGHGIAPDFVSIGTEAVVGQQLQASGRLIVNVVLSLQVD